MSNFTGDPKAHNVEDFAKCISGNCLCSSIRVTLSDAELFTRRRGHICHCENCRKVSGSFAASNFVVEEAQVEILDNERTLTRFIDTATGSGIPVDRYFCSRCGNPIKSVTPLYPGKIILKMGLFPRIPAPEFETFALHRHPWQGVHPGVTQYKIKAFGEKL